MKKGFYIVGGAVRDYYLYIKEHGHISFYDFKKRELVHDFDYIAYKYTEDEMLSLGFQKVGKDFPVFLEPLTGNEYALTRTERSTGPGYKDFKFEVGVSMEEDLKRRDLTMNSMALSESDKFIDPFNGRQDIDNKILRHTSEAFKEDPLRVLRIARFRAKYPDFEIAKETVELINSMKNMLTSLSKDRVFKELEKALSEKAPYMFFITLKELGVLDIVFPEIYSWTRVNHENKYHMEGSVFNHSMLVLKTISEISKDPITRFGALFHDIGKVPVFEKDGKFHRHASADIVIDLFKSLKDNYRIPTKYIKIAEMAAINHHKIYNVPNIKNSSIVKMITSKKFPKEESDLKRVLDIAVADSYGRIIHVSGPRKVLELYDSLYAVDFAEYKKGERQYESVYTSGKYKREDFVEKDFIEKAFKAIQKVNVRDFVKNETSVLRIKQELHRRRIRAVASI